VTQDSDDWNENRRFVREKLKDLKEELSSIRTKVDDMTLQLAVLKTKVAFWAMLVSGAASAAVSIIVALIRGH
jgi:prophage DNA circulation protein